LVLGQSGGAYAAIPIGLVGENAPFVAREGGSYLRPRPLIVGLELDDPSPGASPTFHPPSRNTPRKTCAIALFLFILNKIPPRTRLLV